jgi:hypothetical protein
VTLRLPLLPLVALAALGAAAPALAQPSASPPADAPRPPPPTGVGVLPDQPPAAAPSAWVLDPAHAESIQQLIANGAPDGVSRLGVRVWSYRPAAGGGQLIISVTRFELDAAAKAPAGTGEVVRQRVADVRASVEAMTASDGAAVRQLAWSERTNTAQKVVEADLEWAHDELGTTSVVRARWTLDEGVLDERRVECVLAAADAATLRPACDRAIDSLVLPAIERRLVIAVASAPPEEGGDGDGGDSDAGAGATPGSGAGRAGDAPTMRATPDGVAIPPRPAPDTAPARDWRPMYVVAGMVLLIGALLWNRGRRKALERAEGPAPRARRGKDRRDDDSDALADAAEGKAPARDDADDEEAR